MTVLGSSLVDVFAITETVELSDRYVGDVVKIDFSTLVPGRETFGSLELLVSPRETVTDEEGFANCSVVSVR